MFDNIPPQKQDLVIDNITVREVIRGPTIDDIYSKLDSSQNKGSSQNSLNIVNQEDYIDLKADVRLLQRKVDDLQALVDKLIASQIKKRENENNKDERFKG